MQVQRNPWQVLKASKPRLTRQQYLTIKGQLASGETDAAMRGLSTLFSRRRQPGGSQ